MEEIQGTTHFPGLDKNRSRSSRRMERRLRQWNGGLRAAIAYAEFKDVDRSFASLNDCRGLQQIEVRWRAMAAQAKWKLFDV
jgi:hypothetical protein